MTTRIVTFPRFDEIWPVSAEHLARLLGTIDEVEIIRAEGDRPPAGSPQVDRLFWLAGELGAEQLDEYPALVEAFTTRGYSSDPAVDALLEERGIRRIAHPSEGYWGQSVSEFALGLTIAALRGIPRRSELTLRGPGTGWEYEAEQLSDDLRFTSGTVAGKRVRIVGAGNIASRYASFVSMLGADVAAWDPFASEPSFHRAGARREWQLDELPRDADIFVPMVPHTPATVGPVTAELIRAIPDGALVVMVTRAAICDTVELRRRVLADELALAADVFDVEPLPADDPLLGRSNVVHTPHIAGRTVDAGFRWAEALVEQLPGFDPSRAPAPARLRR